MKRYFKTGMAAILAILMTGCTEGDKFQPGREIVLITGTDYSPIIRIDGDTYPISVSATGKTAEDVTVELRYDKSVLDEYNAANKTNYKAVPEDAVRLDESFVTIRRGQAVSNSNNMQIVSHDYVEEGNIYVVPLVISNVQGGKCEILDDSRYALLRPTNEFTFMAYDVNDANLSSNYIFPDDKAINLSTYTYEIKFYAYRFKNTGSNAIGRVCQWSSKDEKKSNMLRFGESGYPGNSLQLVSPAGNIVSNTLFDEGKWYMLSLVYDGSSMTMYVNGVPEEKKGTGDGTTTFQRFELGMSWTSYTRSQLFNGRIAEVRIWDRALSVSEMKEGICNVSPQSEGLRAYWKFNDGEGHVFHDATGNGYDMDWSHTWREATEGKGLEEFDKSQVASAPARWVLDDNNKCRN